MKRFTIVFFIAVTAVSCICSCDFIRMIAGRPSSEQIEHLKETEKQKKENQAAIQAADSLRRASEAAYDAFVTEGVKIKKASDNPNLAGRTVDKGLYFALGAFSKESNARKLESKVESCGYEADCIPYNNGFTLVVAVPSADYLKLRDSYLKIKEEQFFPADAWILECE